MQPLDSVQVERLHNRGARCVFAFEARVAVTPQVTNGITPLRFGRRMRLEPHARLTGSIVGGARGFGRPYLEIQLSRPILGPNNKRTNVVCCVK
jgi:hypothetical protein